MSNPARARSIADSLAAVWPRECRDRDREFGGLALDRRRPMVVVIAYFQQAVRGATNVPAPRRSSMLTVDGERQAVEESAAARTRRPEQTVHRGLSHTMRNDRRRRCRAHRLAVDAAAPAGAFSSPFGGSMPLPSGASPSTPWTSADTAQEPSPWSVRDVFASLAQAPSQRQKRIASRRSVLPAPFGPTSARGSPRVQARSPIITEMRQRRRWMRDKVIGSSAFLYPLPLWRRWRLTK